MVGRFKPIATSIQAVLEKAVSTFLGVPTHINGSGRTDAGVHALGQVANFFTDKECLPYRILRGLNALTPRDITVKEVEIVDDCLRRAARRPKPALRISDSQPLNTIAVSPQSRLARP